MENKNIDIKPDNHVWASYTWDSYVTVVAIDSDCWTLE